MEILFEIIVVHHRRACCGSKYEYYDLPHLQVSPQMVSLISSRQQKECLHQSFQLTE